MNTFQLRMAQTALLLDLSQLLEFYNNGERKMLQSYIRRSDRPLEHDRIILKWVETSKGKASYIYMDLKEEVPRLENLIKHKEKLVRRKTM